MLSFFAGIVLYQLMLLALILIFAFVCMKKSKEKYYRLGIIAICFVFYFLMRILPNIIGAQNFELPWESRLLSIISGLLCFLLFKKHFSESNYLKIKQEKEYLRATIIVSVITIIGYLIIFYLDSVVTSSNIMVN